MMFLYSGANMLNFCQAPPEVICCVQCECERLAYSVWAGGLVKGGEHGDSSCRQLRESWSPHIPNREQDFQAFPDDLRRAIIFCGVGHNFFMSVMTS